MKEYLACSMVGLSVPVFVVSFDNYAATAAVYWLWMLLMFSYPGRSVREG